VAIPAPQREIVIPGTRCDVAYAQAADGSRPAKEFMQALAIKDRLKFADLFAWIAEHGKIANTEKFRPSLSKISCKDGDVKRSTAIAEFKIHAGSGQRILAYQDGRQWVLVMGFPKGANLETALEKAHTVICEDLWREHRRTERR
jgi:putative component of toxin-antitoxin plasmid stabilization module